MISRNIATILIISSLSVFLTTAEANLSKEQAYALFRQGNEAFRGANSANNDSEQRELYKKVILNYEKLINEGEIKNAKLYYNLANAYFLNRDIGKAILNYLRAEKLDNSDANIQKNLAFARSKRIDKINLKTEERVLQTLFFWHYDFPIKTKFILTCLFFAALCISLTVVIWFGRTAPGIVITVISGILTVCFLVSVVLDAHKQTNSFYGVITTQEVVARQGDGPNYSPSFKEPLHTGTEFKLLERRQGWLHIKLFDDSDGWIPDNTADLI